MATKQKQMVWCDDQCKMKNPPRTGTLKEYLRNGFLINNNKGGEKTGVL